MVEEYTLTTMSFQDTARGSAEVTLEYMCHAFYTRANGMRRSLAISRTIVEAPVAGFRGIPNLDQSYDMLHLPASEEGAV
jgi:hypothetical protein